MRPDSRLANRLIIALTHSFHGFSGFRLSLFSGSSTVGNPRHKEV
jgi:hypothetical protein